MDPDHREVALTGAAYSLTDASRALARGWNRFFHAPQDLRVCAAVRIAYAAVMLVNLAVLYPDLTLWYTDEGILPAEASRQLALPYSWSVLWLLPSTALVVRICFGLLAVHTVCLLVGLWPQLNAAASLVWLMSFQSRNLQILDGEDWAMRVILFWLIFTPTGQCWSVDSAVRRWWNRRTLAPAKTGPLPQSDGVIGPAWGLRMLQLQMAIIFFTAGLWKLGGEPWLNGTAVYTVARMDDYFGRFPVPDWPFDHPWPVALMTWAVIAVELAAPLLIWFRETRRLCLVAILLFHLANEWTMHLFLFHWIMLVGWMSFLTPADFACLRRIPLTLALGENRGENRSISK